MRWRVTNSLGADGLPADAWAAAAHARLRRLPVVERADVVAGWDEDPDHPAGGFGSVEVNVVCRGDDRDAITAAVQAAVVAALADVHDGEAGWTAYEWSAARLEE